MPFFVLLLRIMLAVVTQLLDVSGILGGYFHGRNQLTYGVDVGKIRWLGVLQVALLTYVQLLHAFIFSG